VTTKKMFKGSVLICTDTETRLQGIPRQHLFAAQLHPRLRAIFHLCDGKQSGLTFRFWIQLRLHQTRSVPSSRHPHSLLARM
jgi:hypothetical protein